MHSQVVGFNRPTRDTPHLPGWGSLEMLLVGTRIEKLKKRTVIPGPQVGVFHIPRPGLSEAHAAERRRGLPQGLVGMWALPDLLQGSVYKEDVRFPSQTLAISSAWKILQPRVGFF